MADPTVHGVMSKQNHDLSELMNRVAWRNRIPPRLLLAQGISESNLDELAAREGVWPDVSYGLWQQTVAYAPIGTQQDTPENRAYVQQQLTTDVELAADIAARRLLRYWQGDPLDAMSRYNSPGLSIDENPNAANLRRGWEASMHYVGDISDVGQRLLTAAADPQWAAYTYRLDPPPDGITTLDCSLWVEQVCQLAGVPLPPGVRTVEQIRGALERAGAAPLDWAAVPPGALLFFVHTYEPGEPSQCPDGEVGTHIGISLGAGSRAMLDCHDGRTPAVGQTDISSLYWQGKLLEARLWAPAEPAPPPEPTPDPRDARIAELESTLGYLSHDLANIFLQQAQALLTARSLAQVRTIVQTGLRPAINTLSRGGAPENGGS